VSTLKSSDDHLTLNADGSSKNILFQADGVQKASISSAGLFTSTTIDATALTGNLPAISGANLTGVGGGLTQSSTWYIATTYQPASGNEIITGWAETNAAGYNRLGTSPTQSSGTFTLPETGWWLVSVNLTCSQATGTADSWGLGIKTSTDSGASYDWAGAQTSRWSGDLDYNILQFTTTMILKCEDESTFRFYGWLASVDESQFYVRGGSQNANHGSTYMNIMKLADV
jgi:hypothetical protein